MAKTNSILWFEHTNPNLMNKPEITLAPINIDTQNHTHCALYLIIQDTEYFQDNSPMAPGTLQHKHSVSLRLPVIPDQ